MLTTRRMTLLVMATSETCAGHGDHEGEIQEIPIVRLLLAGEIQAADARVAALAVIFMRVMQREDRVHEQPGQHDRDHAERQIIPGVCLPTHCRASATMATRLAIAAAAVSNRMTEGALVLHRRAPADFVHCRQSHHPEGQAQDKARRRRPSRPAGASASASRQASEAMHDRDARCAAIAAAGCAAAPAAPACALRRLCTLWLAAGH